MEEECSITYANPHPISQITRFFSFLVILTIYAALVLLCALAAPPFGYSPFHVIAAGTFLALPWAASEAIEILFLISTFRFSLQPEYFFLRRGAIDPKYHMIPYENIQDAQVSQHILGRLLGLATVVVSTPAGSEAVPDLPLPVAQKFREELLELSRLHKGMAE
jgi:membrane protein YdbS with pleckstrin-like domain